MSFKREGDDGSQLNLLKKRRVAELLAEDIPEDEAILMSSGRYACTVCHYRPVFDTVDMLTIHRAGKKHQHANDRHFAKKRELALLVQKRYHESQLKRAHLQESSEDPGPAPLLQKVEEAKRHVLLKEAPYNPYHSHRNEGPSTKPKGKLFFQGIRQMQLKNMNQKPANQERQNSNPTNQGQQSSNPSNQVQTDSTNQGLQTSNSANQKPQNLNSANQDGANLNYAQKQQQNKAAMHERIKSFSKQTSVPGVPSIEIKPYVPKSRRGKAVALTNSSKESKQSGNTYVSKAFKSNSEGSSNQSSDTYSPTSSPGEGTHYRMHDDEVVQGDFHGQEVAQYISEFQSEMQEHAGITVPRSNVNLSDNSDDNLKAGNVEPKGSLKAVNIEARQSFKTKHGDGLHSVSKRPIEHLTFASSVRNEQLPFVNMAQKERVKCSSTRHNDPERFVGEQRHMQLKSESERQNERMKNQRKEIHLKTLHSDEGKARESEQEISNLNTKDINSVTPHSSERTAQENKQVRNVEGKARRNEHERSNLNLADGQKVHVEQVEEKREEAFAPLSRWKIPSGGFSIRWKSGQGKSQSRNVGGSAASPQPSKDSDRKKGRTVTDDKQTESSQDGRFHPALQLFNDRQKSGISPRDERTGLQTGVNSAQTPKEGSQFARKEEERHAGRKGEKLKKDRQKGGQQMSEERRKELQRYLELTSAGWIQDPGGQWVKGQDVEFDSDEEQPS